MEVKPLSKKQDNLLLFDLFSSFDEELRQKRKIVSLIGKLSIRFNVQKTLEEYFK